MSAVLLALLLANARRATADAKATAHYVDGVHQAAFDDAVGDDAAAVADRWATHDCETLLAQHSARDPSPAVWPTSPDADEALRYDLDLLQQPSDCASARLLLYALHSDCGSAPRARLAARRALGRTRAPHAAASAPSCTG